DFIALCGDPSDKLPGVAGLGAAGAAQVVRTYGTLENALRAGRFSAQAKNLRLFRSIATMDRKAPLPRLSGQKPTWRKAAAPGPVVREEGQIKQRARRPVAGGAKGSTANSLGCYPHRRYNWRRAMPDVFWRACRSRGSLKNESSFGSRQPRCRP